MKMKRTCLIAVVFVVLGLMVAGCKLSPEEKMARTLECQADCYRDLPECKDIQKMIEDQRELLKTAYANIYDKQVLKEQEKHAAMLNEQQKKCRQAEADCLKACEEKYK
jgi:hypothetical protein